MVSPRPQSPNSTAATDSDAAEPPSPLTALNVVLMHFDGPGVSALESPR
jgi:hypothetical protein